MANNEEGRDPSGGQRSAQPGGSPSRGPNPDPGGAEEPGGLIPPYEGRTTGADAASSKDRAESVDRQLADTKSATPGTASPADERAVSPDDVTDGVPDSPKGVGKSTTRSGEDVVKGEGKERGRHEAGTKGESERPVGVSDERDSAGVDPQGSEEGAPTTPSGDQGG